MTAIDELDYPKALAEALARAEKAESECQDHMNAIAYTTAQFANVARRAEAAEKERDQWKARSDEAQGWSLKHLARAEAAEKGVVDWAVERWNAEVKNRPLVNVHRRTLDDTWRQVMRKYGGDPDTLVGPSHDKLLEAKP